MMDRHSISSINHNNSNFNNNNNSINNSPFNSNEQNTIGTIGSWNAPETNSFGRGGWNADGSARGEAVFDDGTAIWGNPSAKKTGIDWTEKESKLNPPQAANNNKTAEKRIQRSEPIISSINGTEAWGAPAAAAVVGSNKQQNNNLCGPQQHNNSNSNSLNTNNANNQSRNPNDISGNTYGNNNINNNKMAQAAVAAAIGWGEPSSSSSPQQQATTSVTNENSSLPTNSVWNNHGSINIINDSKLAKSTSDWLSSSSASTTTSTTTPSIAHASTNARCLNELADQLESTNLFDAAAAISSSISSSSSNNTISSIVKNSPAGLNCNVNDNNLNLDNLTSSIGGGNLKNSGNFINCNALNDLKQMSANFTSSLLFDSPGHNGNSLSTSNNQQSHPLDSASAAAAASYSSAVGPSRDLLKQMVRQIQLAVQAGHLNAHILEQPLSTPTLQLVYQLLQQIKILQQLQELQRANDKSSDLSSQRNLDMQINRARQNISLLQAAITQQQQSSINKNDNVAGPAADLNNGAANSYSYATISKLSTKKVPSANNMSNLISNNNNNSNIDSFRRSSLLDTVSNSSSDLLRSAQATFDANAIIDKNLPSLLRAQPGVNNILNNVKGDFSKAQCFTSGLNNDDQQQSCSSPPSKGMQSATSTSDPSSAWSFSSGDFVTQSWSRISPSDIPQDQQNKFNNSDQQSISSFSDGKPWRGSSAMSTNIRDDNCLASMAPGANLNLPRPNSASTNNTKPIGLNENDILARSATSFYNWGQNSGSISNNSAKRNFEAPSSFNQSTVGGFSLQSNPWLFPPTSSALNMGCGLDGLGKTNSIDNNGRNNSSPISKLDNGSTNFMRPSNELAGSIQRGSQSALYNWSNMTPASLQFNLENNSGSNKPHPESSASRGSAGSSSSGSRPAPPPGLMNSFVPMSRENNSSSSGISSFDSKSGVSPQLQTREPASSLWSGSWFD